MGEMVKVEINGVTKEYEVGTTLLSISKEYEAEYENDII